MNPANPIRGDRTLRGEEAYLYGLKARAKRHHCMAYGTFCLEMDRLETARRRYSREVRPITYLPIYLKAVALVVARHPEANAILFRKPFGYRVVQFERVDVSLPITRRIGDRWVTFIGTVRDAPTKPLATIQEELCAYQRCPQEQSFAIRRFQRLARMPFWLAQLFHRRLTRDPAFFGRSVGTCGLTLLEGDWGEHLFPVAPSSVVFGLGAARREPVVSGQEIVIRRMLKCCLMIDNYVVPGLTGAQMAREFKELLESGSVVTRELSPECRTGVSRDEVLL
jgi:pyruvate/2-oxoglutarate dehydrogenase complex dihydrolipoamide acyltransferase (E2) component